MPSEDLLRKSFSLLSCVFSHSHRVSLPCHRRHGGLQGCPLARPRAGRVQHVPHSPAAAADPSLRSVSVEYLNDRELQTHGGRVSTCASPYRLV